MNLRFPELRGGTVQGLNDAGVENFQGAIDDYLSRECGQNTGDAIRSGVKTARLEFHRLTMSADSIPGFAELRATLDSCLEKWGKKPKEQEFFGQAISIAARSEIDVLRISDFGTTGLTGDDSDETGRWFALVKSQGVSNKEDTAGGSFGIGKSSPFAASRFRTVFYGTRTEQGGVALQGVSRLVTHKNKEGKLTQGVGFIGNYDDQNGDPVFRAIRDEASIPAPFRRSDPGTDIWIIGYRSGSDWSDDLVRSIVTNFWPAIYNESIQFRVGQMAITKENLKELIDRHIGQEEFEAHHYYKALESQPAKKTLSHVGSCELFLTTSAPDLPRKICMVRKTGMRIYDYQPKACRVPFSGLFTCTDPEGNKLLRQLEPPKHDIWDPKRVEGDAGKKAMDEIKLWIREEVRKLNPLFSGSSFNENELAKYVPDSEPDNLPQEDAGTSDEESLDPKPAPANPEVKPVLAVPLVPTGSDAGAGDIGPGYRNNGGSGNGNGDGHAGPRKGVEQKPPRITLRSYRTGPSEYHLVLRSTADFQGGVRIYAIGEDGTPEAVNVQSAFLAGRADTPLTLKRDSIQNLTFAGAQPVRVVVTLGGIERRSLGAGPQL